MGNRVRNDLATFRHRTYQIDSYCHIDTAWHVPFFFVFELELDLHCRKTGSGHIASLNRRLHAHGQRKWISWNDIPNTDLPVVRPSNSSGSKRFTSYTVYTLSV